MTAPTSYILSDSSTTSLSVRLQQEITELRHSIAVASDNPLLVAPFSLQVKGKELCSGFNAFLGIRKIMTVTPAILNDHGDFQCTVQAVNPEYITNGRPQKVREKPAGILKEFVGTEAECKLKMKEFTKGKRTHQVLKKEISPVTGLLDTFHVTVLLASMKSRKAAAPTVKGEFLP